MSKEYDEYLKEHRANVYKGFCWMVQYLPELFDISKSIDPIAKNYEKNELLNTLEYNIHRKHDISKNSEEEYDAYDKYFYGGNRSFSVVEDFNKAWLHHIHMNQHHWQHWILHEDDPAHKDTVQILEIPYVYVIEMVCDWWSFSWKTGNLYGIFDWYKEHEDNMLINRYSRATIEKILNKMKSKLDALKEAGELAAGGAAYEA